MIANLTVPRDCYNRRSFSFEHHIHENALFDPGRVAQAVAAEPELTRSAYCSNAPAALSDGWAEGLSPEQASDAIHGISTNDSLVILRHLERSVRLGPALREIIAQVVAAVGPALRDDAKIARATILIAAPRRVTPYHIDSDTNFLFQLHGEKPSHAPHWAQNRDKVSVALSINFDLYSMERIGRIHRLNARLRRMGFAPRAPGESAWKDEIKLALSAVRRGMRRVAGAPLE